MIQKAVSLLCVVVFLSLVMLPLPDSFALTQEEARALMSATPAGSVPADAGMKKNSGDFFPLPGPQQLGTMGTTRTSPQETFSPASIIPGTAAAQKTEGLSDFEKARLMEYRDMSDIEKARLTAYCGMSDLEKTKFDRLSKISPFEKEKLSEYNRLSEREKVRLNQYSVLSDLEKIRYERYCKSADTEKARSPEFYEKSKIEKELSDPGDANDPPQPQPFTAGELSQFGYNFFRPESTGFPPQTDVPVGDDYLVGPGDQITLQLWGSATGSYDLEVNRSGEVYLPRAGAIRVWGVPFGRLQELFRSHLARELKDFQLNVNMGKLRMMKIYVVGEVQSPGGYNVSSLSTVLNALSAAGGPTKNGSLRTITVRRQGKPPVQVDLYHFFLKGDKSCDVRLLPGDTIYVPVIRRVAGIAGNVRRPAIFELRNEKSLTELLALAGGINPTGSLQRVQVVRVKAHDKKLVSDFSVDPRAEKKSLLDITGVIKIENFDLVRVFQIDTTLRDQVRIEGYVRRPGDYALKKGLRVKDLFGKDDILPETYNHVAVITRLLPPDYHPEKFSINLGLALAGDETHNVELHEFDRLKVFSRWEMEEKPVVRINGDVQKPGEYRLLDNMRLRDLVYDAGNLKKTAYLDNVEITRTKVAGNEVSSQPINVNLKEALAGNPDHNIPLEPYDSVQIRRIPNWVEETERYVNITGEVMFPGTYPIYKGERLSSVLARAGGYTPKAYLYGAKFTRVPVRELQQQRMDEFISRTEQDIASKMQSLSTTATSKEELDATKTSLEGVQRSLEKLKQLKAEGRMTISLTSLDTLRKSPYDLELMGGDTLTIPQSIGAVTVLGEVYNQTTLLHLPGRDLTYYLNEAGGATGSGEEDEIYLVKADGSVTSRQQSSFGIHWDTEGKKWTFGGFYSLQPQPGDTIVVPKQLEKTAWLRTIKDITTIISQIALSAGTVFIGLK
jgi:protein involved in polysaccharide export with SLBB domain